MSYQYSNSICLASWDIFFPLMFSILLGFSSKCLKNRFQFLNVRVHITIMTSEKAFLSAMLHKKMSYETAYFEFSPCSFSTSQDKSKTKRLPFNSQWRAQIPAKSYLGGPQATSQPPQPSPMSHSSWGFNEEAEATAHPRHADHLPVDYSPPFSCFRLPLQGEREHSACLQPSLVFWIIPHQIPHSFSRKLCISVHNIYQFLIPYC